MKEEKVTLNIIKWLQESGWEIICYDFPQSGTGIMLHPNSNENNEKNKGGIIHDIIAVKDSMAVFFENKDRFVLADFEKLFSIKTTDNYSNDLYKLIGDRTVFYGAGFPKLNSNINKSFIYRNMVDFIITTDILGYTYIEYDLNNIF